MDKLATLNFGEFTPDQPDTKTAVVDGKNVLPNSEGYLPLPAETQISDAINARARGAFAVKNSSGTVYNYVGNETKLYQLVGGISHTDITRASGAYATGSDEYWEFVKFGNDIYACNFTDYLQKETIGIGGFTDVTAAPKSRHMSLISNFMVMGNIDESSTVTPNKVRWSAINDPSTWTATVANQAGEQILYSSAQNGGGWIQKVIGGEDGIIIQEHSIWRMSYVGGQLIFQFDEIAPGIGTPARNSVIDLGEQIFFLGQDGFYKIVNGTSIEPIGEQKVDRWFFSNLRIGAEARVIGAADYKKRLVAWLYPDTSAMDDTPNKIIFYNWAIGKWSPPADLDAHWIYSSLSVGQNTDDNIATYTDDLNKLVDSTDYSGGSIQLGIYDTDHKKASFSGTAKTAQLDTVEAQLISGRCHITGLRPLVEGNGCTISASIGYRDNLNNENVSFTSASSPEGDTNICHQRIDTRYARARINTSGDFDYMVGAEVFGVKTGER